MLARPKTIIALFLSCALTAKQAAGQRPPSARPNIVTFAATEYAFHGPTQAPPGFTTIRLQNRGKEVHWMEIFRLSDGKTATDFIAAVTAGKTGFQPPHSWTTAVGGPGWIGPGGTSNQTAYFQSGNYVLVCRFPGVDGVPHLKKGMMHALHVRASALSSAAAEPQADITITVSDSAFGLRVPISAGTHTVRVINKGSYRHELYIFRLAPGKSMEDYRAWERGGLTRSERPGRPSGGVTPFEAGTHVWFTAAFEAGEYIFGDESGEGREIFRTITVR